MIDVLTMTSALSSFTPENLTTTLFLGDLSVYCQEKEVFALFRNYGPIESIQIKRSDDSAVRKPHLSYGFVKFQHRESAERALMELNGKLLLGRALRLGWASNNVSDRNYQSFHIKKEPTAQIHITFLCPLDMYPITEEKLRSIYDRFGEIIDVTINRVECNQESFVHSGYGFIHYPLTEAGVNGALTAIQTMNDRVVDSIVFKCTISHGLETFLKTRNSSAAAVPRPNRKNAHSFDSLGSNNSSRNATARTSPTASTSPGPLSYMTNAPPGFPLPTTTATATSLPIAPPAHGFLDSNRDSLRSNGSSSSFYRESKVDSIFSFNEDRSSGSLGSAVGPSAVHSSLLSALPSSSPTSLSTVHNSAIPPSSSAFSVSSSPFGGSSLAFSAASSPVGSNYHHQGHPRSMHHHQQTHSLQGLGSRSDFNISVPSPVNHSSNGRDNRPGLSPMFHSAPNSVSSAHYQQMRGNQGFGAVGGGSGHNTPSYSFQQQFQQPAQGFSSSSYSFFNNKSSSSDSNDRLNQDNPF